MANSTNIDLQGPVQSLAFSSDGKYLASAGIWIVHCIRNKLEFKSFLYIFLFFVCSQEQTTASCCGTFQVGTWLASSTDTPTLFTLLHLVVNRPWLLPVRKLWINETSTFECNEDLNVCFYSGGMDHTVRVWNFSKILQDQTEGELVPGVYVFLWCHCKI